MARPDRRSRLLLSCTLLAVMVAVVLLAALVAWRGGAVLAAKTGFMWHGPPYRRALAWTSGPAALAAEDDVRLRQVCTIDDAHLVAMLD